MISLENTNILKREVLFEKTYRYMWIRHRITTYETEVLEDGSLRTSYQNRIVNCLAKLPIEDEKHYYNIISGEKIPTPWCEVLSLLTTKGFLYNLELAGLESILPYGKFR